MIIKTVKALIGLCFITSLFYFSVTQASRPHPDIEQLLTAPGFVDHFTRQTQKATQSLPHKNPLVVQAELWVRKPPEPKQPQNPTVRETPKPTPKPEIRPAVSTPKFTLIATSLCRDEAGASLALISDAGGQQHWLHIGDKIGYLKIKDILNGKILYKDGDRSDELAVVEPESPTAVPAKSRPPERIDRPQPVQRLALDQPTIKTIPAGRTYSRPLPRALRER